MRDVDTSGRNIMPQSNLTPLAAGLMLTLSSVGTSLAAEDVTLLSPDGSISITGEFISYEDGAYVVDSQFGMVRVLGDQVNCTGAACPVAQLDAGTRIVWDVSLWGQRRAFTEHVEKLAELVSERTYGLFTLNISYGGLSDSRENLDGIAAGDFEMAQFCAGYHPEKNPTITVLELPFLGVSSLEQEVALSLEVYGHPAVQSDMARWNASLIMPSPLPQYNIIGTGFPPTSLEDFSRMKVRATGGIGDAVASLGAELVSIPAPQVQDAMNAGDVNAVSFAPHAHMAFGTVESATWWTTNLNPGTVNCPVVANTIALKQLPDVYRTALETSVQDALAHYIDHYNGETMDAWGPALRTNSIIELTINDEILSSINNAVAAPAARAWIAQQEARGLPAQELYDLVIDKIAEGT
jgi:TRAP-type C4-dicarboxylate transport system substrate-binding protein